MKSKRIYLEIRIECQSDEDKAELAKKLDSQVSKLGLSNRPEYVRQIIELDAATHIMNRINNPVCDLSWDQLKMLFGERLITIEPSNSFFNPFEASLHDRNNNNLDETFEIILKNYGFESQEEFNKLVSKVDLSNSDTLESFNNWKINDYTKKGLLKLIKR